MKFAIAGAASDEMITSSASTRINSIIVKPERTVEPLNR